MKTNFYLVHDEVHNRVIRSLYEGCPTDKELLDVTHYTPSDVAVVFGVYKKAVPFSHYRGQVIEEQRRRQRKTIVLETGYINRGNGPEHHYAVGFNGLNGRADFRNQFSPDDRFRKLGIDVKPWTINENGVVLLCGQVPWDASVQDINMPEWILDMAHLIQQITDREIVFRPHPLAPMSPIKGIEYSTAPVMQDLNRAKTVVTFNSNTAVEAVLEGIPSFSFDVGSMAYAVTDHDLNNIENPKMCDRAQWVYDLAYTQWTLDEMRSGETWAHLFH